MRRTARIDRLAAQVEAVLVDASPADAADVLALAATRNFDRVRAHEVRPAHELAMAALQARYAPGAPTWPAFDGDESL
jgi:hypothetical protein